MLDELEAIEIPVPCPACGSNTLKCFGWIKANEMLTCSMCSEPIRLDNHGFRDALVDAEKSIARARKQHRSR